MLPINEALLEDAENIGNQVVPFSVQELLSLGECSVITITVKSFGTVVGEKLNEALGTSSVLVLVIPADLGT